MSFGAVLLDILTSRFILYSNSDFYSFFTPGSSLSNIGPDKEPTIVMSNEFLDEKKDGGRTNELSLRDRKNFVLSFPWNFSSRTYKLKLIWYSEKG